MHGRRFAALLSALCVALAVALLSRGSATEPARPNIVFIVADDLGYGDLGIHGCNDIPTPALDALMRDGVRCTNGYVSGPYCSPTRAGLMTGRYQTRYGHEFNPAGRGPAGRTHGLPLDQGTLAERLGAAGYRTALVGKWHLGTTPEFHPTRRGFDEFFGFLDGAHPYLPQAGASIFRNEARVTEAEYLTDAFAREAVGFVERNRDRPFFLYLAFNGVHTPMHAPNDRLAKFPNIADPMRRKYAAMLTAMDEAVARVMARLRSSGIDRQTLVAFISDNGGPTMPGTTINASRNTPLRGSKRTTLEGGIRVPFALRWPGVLPASQEYARPVIQLDLHATALAAARVRPHADWKLDGVDLLPHLKTRRRSAPHEALYWRFGRQMAIRKDNWKLVRYALAAEGGAGTSPFRLYDLARDVGETRDLALEQPDRVAELQRLWDAWNTENIPPRWGGGNTSE
jgi:arylsulfatase A-like enzyme